MAGILRQQERPEMMGDPSARIIYFPVRHHSPACAYHLRKAMESFSPDCVLIEGPSDCDFLIPYLTMEGTVPPVCIYSSFDDKSGAVSEDKNKYRAYYPFLAYSPEYAALKGAAERGIPAYFIDMPYALMLTMFGERDREKSLIYDESAEYYKLAAEKSGCRCFSEFWERGFERNIRGDTEDFVKSVYALGRYMRELSPSDERNDCREAYMRGRISHYAESFDRIMVVAGAYHIHGLEAENKKVKTGRYPKADAAAYIMPYSFAETDSRSGYGAGIPFPAFYSEVWKRISAGAEKPYTDAVEHFIVSTARYARSKQPVSLPDETEALYMAQSLAALRGNDEPGAFELIDGVRSAFVKGDVNTSAAFELDYLLRRMTGLGAGEVNIPDDGTGNIIPPCVADFRALCRKYRINTGNVARQSTVLDVVKNPAHYEKSCFFHRMEYMKTGFCSCESGPDYAKGRDAALIREKWSYRYSTAVETALIDLSVYGGSVESICMSLLRKEHDGLRTAGEAGRFLLRLYVTGFAGCQPLTEGIRGIVRDDLDFVSQCAFMAMANRLIMLMKNLGGEDAGDIYGLLEISFGVALCRISSVCAARGDSVQGICAGLRLMYSLTGEYDPLLSKSALMREISAALENSSPMIYGVCLALCSRAGLVSEEDYGESIRAYMLSADGRDSADFITGVISAGRDIIFTSRTVLESVDNALRRMDSEKFREVLPQLRRAFTEFLPSETARISKSIAEMYGIRGERFSGSMIFSAEEIRRAAEIDMKALETLKKYGLYGGGDIDGGKY